MKSSPTNNPSFARNNFDLLRLIFALMVCLVHIAELSSFDALTPITQFISSPLAVKCFFVISGFLIVRSFHNTRSLAHYFEKRIRRIYPAYLLVVLSCAFLLLLVSDLGAEAYFSAEWFRYVVFNLLFLNFVQPTLPGVFDELKNSAVNGALWTLKIEVMFYLFVPLLAFMCSRFGKLKLLVGLYLLSILYANLMTYLYLQTGSSMYLELQRQLPGQLSYFLGGALLFYFFELFNQHKFRLVLVAVASLAFDKIFGVFLFEPLALSLIVLFLATFRYLGNFSKYGDLSYGVYIIHFPIIQCLLTLGIFHLNPVLFALSALLLTLAGSFLLWHGIEKVFLSRSSHYSGIDSVVPLTQKSESRPTDFERESV